MSVATEGTISAAADLLASRVGLRLEIGDRGRLSRCVEDAAKTRGIPCAVYVSQLGTETDALQDLVDRVTVQETAFFRDPGQFEALAQHVLPALPAPITIWSAGCSNGQEAYSAAMVLEELGHRGSRVFATDISTNAIERTRRARFSASEIKGLSAERRHRHLVAVDGQFEITPELRARVVVAYHNLLSGPPALAPRSCPVVLCRNVLIYFGHDDIVRILDRIADWMGPHGWLFLGYSESLGQISERFELVHLGNAFVYRSHGRRDKGKTSRRSGRAEGTARRIGLPSASTRTAAIDHQEPPDRVAESEAINFLLSGRSAMQVGNHGAAVTAFRKSAYLDPNQPLAHFSLGIALEASGDSAAAQRAYAAARRILDTCPDGIEENLEGYRIDELARLLDRKLSG